MNKIFAALLTLFIAQSAMAQSTEFDDLTLNGLASYEQLRQEYYIGAIYLRSANDDPAAVITMDGKKRMEMRITAERWTPRRFAQQWNQAILINNDPESQQQFADDILAFTNLPINDLIAGDQIIVDMDPDQGTTIYLNRHKVYSSSNPMFFDVLVSAWIGLRPPSSEFKRDILSLQTNASGTDLLVRFEALKASDARKKEVASWYKNEASATVAGNDNAAGNPALPPPGGNSTRVVAKSTETKPENTKPATQKKTEPSANKPVIALEKPKLNSTPTTAKPVVATPATVEQKAPTPVAAAPAVEKVKKIDTDQIKADYRTRMIRLTYLKTEYPEREIDRGHEGIVVLNVTINRKGQVVSIEEKETAKYGRLNRAASKAVTQSAPFPPIPDELEGETFVFELPFIFKL